MSRLVGALVYRLARLFPDPPVLAEECLRRWDDDPIERLGSWSCCAHCDSGCTETHRTPCSFVYCPAKETS